VARKKILTTFEAGRYCSVNPYTIRHWIRTGKLRAYTTPGGHRRIRREDLDGFLEAHGMPLPDDFIEGPKRILILDKDADTLAGVSRFITALSEKLEVRIGEDAFSAGLEIATFDPHLLIIGIETPGIAGIETCRRIKGDPNTSHIRVILLTESSDVEVFEEAQEAGALRCLIKPPDRAELKRVLRELFPYVSLSKKVAV